MVKQCDGIDEALEFYDSLLSQRENLPYEIDGIVIKVDDEALAQAGLDAAQIDAPVAARSSG